jgi:hypothetical protein
MERWLLFGAVLALGTGCAAPGYEGQLQSWVGRTNAELVNAWGEPGDVIVDEAGRTVFVYATVRTETSGGTRMSTTDPITGQPISVSKPSRVQTFWCKTSFTLGEDETVVAYDYDGNDCQKR